MWRHVNSDFALLKRKDIYQILDGDTTLIEYKDYKLGLPYQRGTDLCEICTLFGCPQECGVSRWVYIEGLLDFGIENDRCDEILNYLFDRSHFSNLLSMDTPDEIDRLYNEIVRAALDKINTILYLSRYELQLVDGHFYITETGKKPVIDTRNIAVINLPYVQGLQERCNNDLLSGNYDSVITKSRTLIEEVLIYILEKNNVAIESKGDLNKIYNQVKGLYNMRQDKSYDGRVNGLLSGLEKIVQSIAEMRNTNSDAHGAGSNRINIKECEAKLVMNSSMIFCEYILSIYLNHNQP